MKPFFSIIIPSLNEEFALPLLFKDLSSQTFKNFEVILVDSYSEDKTTKKASKFLNKLNLQITFSNQRNVSIQRNLGVKTAKGKYLIFCDADNRLPSYFLEGIKYNLNRKPTQIFTCWCQADSQKKADKAIATLINITIEAANKLNYPGALGAMIGCTPKAFKKIGQFNPNITFAEDAEFIRRASKKNIDFKIFKDPHFTVSFRRFRQQGRLKSLQQYAKLHLKTITQKSINRQEYLTGGQTFENNGS
ncbi:glycosyltransferase [Patescibacteria group bacterium]|nr:glycosyltransferase [Patescibacteria group bacterium]